MTNFEKSNLSEEGVSPEHMAVKMMLHYGADTYGKGMYLHTEQCEMMWKSMLEWLKSEASEDEHDRNDTMSCP